MAFLAGTTLVWPGTALDHAWALNQRAHRELAPLGRVIGIPFLLLGATLLAAGVGWFRHALWGWRLAVALIAAQVIGNIVNLFLGHIAEGATGHCAPRLSPASSRQNCFSVEKIRPKGLEVNLPMTL